MHLANCCGNLSLEVNLLFFTARVARIILSEKTVMLIRAAAPNVIGSYTCLSQKF
jgi:hypothetical protein